MNDEQPAAGPTPFHDLDAYLSLPRAGGLALSRDGTRLITSVTTLDPDRTGHVSALWELDPTGERPARRLTRSAAGEAGAAFLADGTVLFTSARPDPEHTDGKDGTRAALWELPAGAGEARVVATRASGISGVVTARTGNRFVLTAHALPSATTADEDETRRRTRRDLKVTAILHEGYPIRYWDHVLGPDQPRLMTGIRPEEPVAGGDPARADLTDLTPDPGRSLDEAEYDLSGDGMHVATTWYVPAPGGGRRSALVLIEVDTGRHRILLDDADGEYSHPRFSPDGTRLALSRHRLPSADVPPDVDLLVVDLATARVTVPASDWDAWPSEICWAPDSRALYVTADRHGAHPVHRVDPATGSVLRLTTDHGAYSNLQISPDGSTLYALRSAVDAAPAPVRLDATAAQDRPHYLPAPAPPPSLPGTLEEVTTTAEDGTPVRAWLVLPDGAGPDTPAPLLLWVHGGPLMSWNTWSWRWNPWLMAAQGYAVLLPDPALSSGYGLDFITRGWGRWGSEPFTDLMTITDVVSTRPDIDSRSTAAMGGSFGGYMVNWIAGHTDRFRGIVTHAGLWDLDQFGPTTDVYDYWRREMSSAMVAANSPHPHVAEISTPMLLIHGDRDYRVPIGQALRLWAELVEHHARDDGSLPHKFLCFPDENHWVLAPQHAKIWYQTVLAFLDTTVRDRPWAAPDLLR
jgi:dipeptidyl aminopeptidase/acylaminoacyl peptidase